MQRVTAWRMWGKGKLLQLGLIVALLALLLTQVSLQTIISMILRADLAGLMVGGGLYLCISLLRAMRVALLADHPIQDSGRMIAPVLASSFGNNVLPGRAGEPIFIWAAHRILHMNWGAGTAIMVIMRVFDIMLVALIFIMCAVWTGFAGSPAFLPRASLLLAIGVAFIALLPWAGTRVVAVLEWLATRTRRQRFIHFVQQEGRHAILAFERLRAPRAYAAVFMTSAFIWVLNFAWIYLLTHSIGIYVSLDQSIIGTTFATFSRAVPLTSIGGWGLHEVGWTAGYTLVGLSREQAISSGFAVNTLMILTSAICGLPACFTVLSARKQVVASPPVGEIEPG